MIYYNGKESTPKLNGVDLSKVMYNGKQIWPKIVTEIALADTKAGDALLWDKINRKKLFTSSDNLSNYPADSYTPIGVVVVPASHDVYGDGSCGVMSLKEMNYNSPDSGSASYQFMLWGGYEDDISLPNLDQAPYVGTGSSVGNASSTLVGQTNDSFLPSDRFRAVQCPHDTDAYYYSSSSSYDQAPSPYLTDGSRNPAYYQITSPSSSSNALADFDGIGNSQVLWDLAIYQSDWKTASSIVNGSSSGRYAPACCCWRYHTEGTSQGDWYLPACGELGYIMPPFNKINNAIANMRTAYGSSVGIKLSTNNGYLSSTEYNSDFVRCVKPYTGNVDYVYKFNDYYVRAFLKVSPLDLSGISPESASNGVYVYANNGKLYSPDSWDVANNDLAVGVAVVTDDCKFAITKGEKPQRVWSNALYGTDVSGLTNYTSKDQAVTDFNGENNTTIIREAASGEDASNNAAHYCYAQTITVNGATKHGYLAAAGEWQTAYDNKSAVDSALSKIEGIAMPTGNYLWSSTEYSANIAWNLRWLGGFLVNLNKNFAGYYTIPVFPLT